jgi:regulator of ribonuclease activity A
LTGEILMQAEMFATADICDRAGDLVSVMEPVFRHFGGRTTLAGRVVCLEVFENNALVRQVLQGPGDGRVLVVDGQGSRSCALVGDQLAKLAIDNGWAGIVVNGAVRDLSALSSMPIAVLALASNPRRCSGAQTGRADVPGEIAGVRVEPGQYLYGDEDGVVILADEFDPAR